ncbi:MAG: GspE/PulE family protein [Candidatus Omnitrophota bacterium]
MKETTVRFGDLLIEKGIITKDQLEAALAAHKASGEFLGITLVKLGFVDENELLPVLSEQLGVDYVKLKELRIPAEVIQRVPARFALHYQLMPVKIEGNVLTIALANPLNVHTLDDVRLLTGLKVKALLSSERDILEAVKKYYGIGAETIEQMLDASMVKKEEARQIVEDIEADASDATVAKLVNQIFLEAYKDRATDIHIEPYEKELKVRYRIDGVLYDAKLPPTVKNFQSAIISRIKIMSGLNIAEKRLPQDGRIKVKVGDAELDLRVSILPTPFGESAVIRILSNAILYNLEELGLAQNDLKLLDELIKRPYGIIFVTGPTGSGKTTTLYSCLSRINKSDSKIITIEDPIEYMLSGITQIQVHPPIGLTFAQGLRSMLRHDPDIMMVGEVRDLETAEITIRVALTGHLVFSTLHTNDAPSSITRLLDMGVEPFLVSSSVQCFIAQRLVRLICPLCKAVAKPPPEIIEDFGLSRDRDISNITVYEGKGCESCKFTGYHGRTAIYEFMLLNDELREMIVSRQPANQIRKKAVSQGMRTLRQDGWEKVLKGVTTIAEVLRVTQ